jgi:hypothetical protein
LLISLSSDAAESVFVIAGWEARFWDDSFRRSAAASLAGDRAREGGSAMSTEALDSGTLDSGTRAAISARSLGSEEALLLTALRVTAGAGYRSAAGALGCVVTGSTASFFAFSFLSLSSFVHCAAFSAVILPLSTHFWYFAEISPTAGVGRGGGGVVDADLGYVVADGTLLV